MSMDEQYREMKQFYAELESFNQRLAASWQDVQVKYDALSPLWHDASRRDHDLQWEPLAEEMTHYLNQQRFAYVEFLSNKLQALERYLTGG